MPRDAYVITGPTSGIGQATAFKMASPAHTVILVGRSQSKLADMQRRLGKDCPSEIVICDFSDISSCRKAASELSRFTTSGQYNIRGVLLNAGGRESVPTLNAQGFDTTFTTNFLGQMAFSDDLIPHLSPGTQLLYVVSKTENPEEPMPRKAGLRGGRFISIKASAKGQWDMSDKDGGPSKLPGANAYTTSKQCLLIGILGLAKENPTLRINGIEPGWIPGTGLSRDAGAALGFVMRWVMGPIAAWLPGGSTVNRASRVLTNILLDEKTKGSGLYYDDKAGQMKPSALVQDVEHRKVVMKDTRELLASV